MTLRRNSETLLLDKRNRRGSECCWSDGENVP